MDRHKSHFIVNSESGRVNEEKIDDLELFARPTINSSQEFTINLIVALHSTVSPLDGGGLSCSRNLQNNRLDLLSKPCFFWQEPVLRGLGNALSMRGEEGECHIRLFGLDSGGPPQMEENNSGKEHLECGRAARC